VVASEAMTAAKSKASVRRMSDPRKTAIHARGV